MAEPTAEQPLNVEPARRLHRALTAGEAELFPLLRDPANEVLRNLLKNPRLDGDHLLALLKRRDLSEELLKEISHLNLTKSSHRLKVALSRNPSPSGAILQHLLPQLHLFELLDLCTLADTTPDQKVAAERVILQRLPTTSLGNKMTLARRGTATLVDVLLPKWKSGLIL